MTKSDSEIKRNAKGSANSEMNFGSYILGEIWAKRLVTGYCWYHNGRKVHIKLLHKKWKRKNKNDIS